MRAIVVPLLAVTLNSAVAACAEERPRTYRGAAVQGVVVDSETNEPVEGAIVVIDWTLEGGLHQDVIGRLLIQETATDAQGRYTFPPWGPLEAKKGAIQSWAPRLHLFKNGYVFKTVSNEPFRATYDPLPDPLTSEYNNKSIEFQRFTGSLAEYCHTFGYLPLLMSVGDTSCTWEAHPRMAVAVTRVNDAFLAARVACSLPSADELHAGGRCKDPRTLSP